MDWDDYEKSWDFSKHPLLKYSNNKSIKSAYLDYLNINKNRIEEAKKLEEKLNEIFIEIYNLDGVLTPDIEDNEISMKEISERDTIISLISYIVGCMFGRFALNEETLIDKDNVIPISDDYDLFYEDNILTYLKNIVQTLFGSEELDNNLNYIADIIGRKGTETYQDTIKKYFLNNFIDDHNKDYQKRPIYWMIDSGKKNGFKCMFYIHRYNEQIMSNIRVNYLHTTQNYYENKLNEYNYRISDDSIADKKSIQLSINEIKNKIIECNNLDEKLAHYANKNIKLDFDAGIKNNYDLFKDILSKIK